MTIFFHELKRGKISLLIWSLAIAFMLGILIVVGIIVVIALLDDTIHDEEYLLRTYDYPILGKVPNLFNTGNKSYGYYSQKRPKSNN